MRFVLVDRFLELKPGKRALASRVFPPDDELFADHFPGFPVVPGVLITEAMGQTGGWLVAATYGFDRWPLLVLVEGAKFRRLVLPGEELRLEVTLAASRESSWQVRAEARVDGERAAEARLVYHAFDPVAAGIAPETFQGWVRSTFEAIGGPAALAAGGSRA